MGKRKLFKLQNFELWLGKLMQKNASKTYENILNYLDVVGKLIEKDSDYSEVYFKNQLLRYFQSLVIVDDFFAPASVLDVGCYPSHIHKVLLMMGYEAYGIDKDPSRISPNLNDCKDRT